MHELLHIAFPDMSETKIDAIARMITYHLWRQGYRRKGKALAPYKQLIQEKVRPLYHELAQRLYA